MEPKRKQFLLNTPYSIIHRTPLNMFSLSLFDLESEGVVILSEYAHCHGFPCEIIDFRPLCETSGKFRILGALCDLTQEPHCQG